MKRKQITITIDQNILKRSNQFRVIGLPRSESCPIALDLKRQGFRKPRVGFENFSYSSKGNRIYYPLSKTAKKFVYQTDFAKDSEIKSRRFNLIDKSSVYK